MSFVVIWVNQIKNGLFLITLDDLDKCLKLLIILYMLFFINKNFNKICK